MIETVSFAKETYPKFQTDGNSARFCMPFALEVCKGVGFDIGCSKTEWAFPNSIPIDKEFNDKFDAMNLPSIDVDYIFSSHCLEHLDNWVAALDYWTSKIKSGGTLFLYLPDYSQVYWRPYHNRKHKHVFFPEVIADYLDSTKAFCKLFVSGVDLNNSFVAFGEKR